MTTSSRARTLLAALAWSVALASSPPDRAAAQQALVLSGGGARGLAHVGVLLELEARGYDPDLVVGNSMGAVVGALYAAGYDAEEIRARVVAIDWSGMFDPAPMLLGPERAPRLPMVTFNLNPGGGRVSRGLFGEWRINRALVRLLFDASARARGDFDRLPRRFRAVAADLRTGEKVVLGSGDLARATRASMAYPGFFTPVEWDERVLVDGGVVDNLPTLEARRLGAAHVIAVDVTRPPEEITSREPLAVAQRALNLMELNLHPDPFPPDILILPLADGALFGPGFPDDALPPIERGVRAARRDLPPSGPRGTVRERTLPPPPDRFSGLRIESTDSTLAAFARQVLGRLVPGPYDAAEVLVALDRLYVTGLFDGIWPRPDGPEGDDGGATLVVRLDAPPRSSLSAAGGFDNDRGGRAWAALDRHTAIAGRPAVLTAAASTDGLDRSATLSARIHALAWPSIAWSAGAHVQERSVRSFADDTRTTVEVLRTGGWLGLEFPHILRERVLTLAGRAEWLDPEDSPGGPAFGPVLRLTSIPPQVMVIGIPLLVEAEARWGDRDYTRFALAGSHILAGETLRAAALMDLRAVSDDAPIDVHPALGDQHAVPGLRWGEVRGRARAVIGGDLALALPVGGFARLRLRTGAVAGDPDGWRRARWVTGGQIGGVWRVPFGAIEAGWGLATVGDGRFDVSVGRAF